jgi:FtsZ-interacting cell division protein ZipA
MDMRILVIAIAVAILVILLAAWALARKRRSAQLRQRFGPEYERVLHQHGDAGRAETVLEEREKRMQGLEIRRLDGASRHRYGEDWWNVQRHFVDDPRAAVGEADELVSRLMSARGYPMADFEQRAADISVDHPQVVENYRAAHHIALRHQRGETSTEDLRKAMVHYRSLFQELLEVEAPERKEVA